MSELSEEKILALKKSEIDDLLVASSKDLEKIISIMRDHLVGTIPVPEEIFFLLCETVSAVSIVGKIMGKITTPENQIKEGYFNVSKEFAMLLSSNLSLLKASKLALADYGISLEEM